MVVDDTHVEFSQGVGNSDGLLRGHAGDILPAVFHRMSRHRLPLGGSDGGDAVYLETVNVIRGTNQREEKVFDVGAALRVSQGHVCGSRRARAVNVWQLRAAELVARTRKLEHENGFGDRNPVVADMPRPDENRRVVGEMVATLVAAHQVVERLLAERGPVLIIDRNIRAVLQREDKGVVTQAGPRHGVVGGGRRGNHDILRTGAVLGHQLVGHKVLVAAVRGGRIVGDIHGYGLVGGDHGPAEMVRARL